MEVLERVASWPVRNAAVGVITAASDPRHLRDQVVGPAERPFPWASVTKLLTALGVLIAVEEGSLSLGEPAGPPGSTIRHLLAHASGLGPGDGPPMAAPGARRIYSNAGFVVLADRLAAATGIQFSDYLREAVLEPLAMERTVFVPPTSKGAAAGAVGPLEDLLSLGRELVSPTLVAIGTHREMTSVQFVGLAGVLPGFGRFDPCDWGLGVEIRGTKHPHWTGTSNSPATFGHFGRSGSFLWVDPEVGVACACLTDRPFGPWAAQLWPEFADAVLAEHGPR